MYSGVYWSIGSRDVNEDSIALEHVRTDKGMCTLMVVCDGIGTLQNGNVVSGYVAECLVRWFYHSGIYMSKARRKKIIRSLSKCLYDCHNELKNSASKYGISWGSTCSMVCIWDRRYVCAHLGDSRVIIVGRKVTRTLTQKHINARGELIKCVGSMNYYRPDFSCGHLRPGNGILVASDGFTEKLGESEMGDMLRLAGEITDERIEKRLSGIGMETAKRGGTDNRSAVYVIV